MGKKGLQVLVCCKVCKKVFTVPEWKWNQKKDKFNFACSNECRNIGNRRKVKIKCSNKNCNNEFEIFPCLLKKTKEPCCSEKCKIENKYKRVEKECDGPNCKEIISVQEFRIRKNKTHFCSRKCQSDFLNKKVEVKCDNPNCGKMIEIHPCKIRDYEKHFCDSKCMGEYRSIICVGENNHRYKEKIKHECDNPNCNNILDLYPWEINTYEKHFCNSKCMGECRSIEWVGENNHNYKERTEYVCDNPNCDEKFYKLESKMKAYSKHFCSTKCMGEYTSIAYLAEGNPFWHGGKSFEPYGPEFNKQLKLKIRKRDNFECQLCGVTEEEAEKTHSVHHIDYDKENNDPKNLITLCNSCHPSTNADREYWQENFTQYQYL